MAKKKKKAKIRLPVPTKPNVVFKDKKKYCRKDVRDVDYGTSDALMKIFGYKRVKE